MPLTIILYQIYEMQCVNVVHCKYVLLLFWQCCYSYGSWAVHIVEPTCLTDNSAPHVVPDSIDQNAPFYSPFASTDWCVGLSAESFFVVRQIFVGPICRLTDQPVWTGPLRRGFDRSDGSEDPTASEISTTIIPTKPTLKISDDIEYVILN